MYRSISLYSINENALYDIFYILLNSAIAYERGEPWEDRARLFIFYSVQNKIALLGNPPAGSCYRQPVLVPIPRHG